MRWIWVLLLVARTAAAHVAVTQPCAACHADTHHAEFREDCAACHTVAAWAPSTFGVAQHARTRYPLDGKHIATPCRACHASRTSFVAGGTACLDCHQGPHDPPHGPTTSDCERCHTTGDWNAWKVAHAAWPLTGAHQREACASCHPGRTAADPPAKFRGIATACTGCHDDAHAGQFAPARDCARCHTTETFTGPFAHRYPLAGAHAQLACARCHPTVELRNGARAVRYKLGYSACKDCHANPHPRTQGDCATCHAATSWAVTAGAKLDHDTTGFALRGAHAAASCSGCHATSSRPESTCESCHRDPHGGKLDGTCAECHTATAWSDTTTLEQHRRTRMPLTGAHALITCNACHKQQSPRAYSDLPVDCYACHSDDARALASHQSYSRACARCHTTITWRGATVPVPDRAAHDARFPISTGAHRDAACAACHVDRLRVRCDGCHTTHATPVAMRTSSCLRCHPRGARR